MKAGWSVSNAWKGSNSCCHLSPGRVPSTRIRHSSFVSPFPPPILRHDAAQAVNVGLRQFLAVLVQRAPWVPLGTEKFPADAVALRAGQIDRERRAESGRGRALFLPLLVLLEKLRADLFRSGGQNFIDESRRERAGGDGVHVYAVRLEFFGERLHQAHDGGFR